MMDRGLSLKEKYGGDKGWKLQLRYDENKPGDILQFRESISDNLSCLIKDDRWKPVEIVQKMEEVPYKQNENKKSSRYSTQSGFRPNTSLSDYPFVKQRFLGKEHKLEHILPT